MQAFTNEPDDDLDLDTEWRGEGYIVEDDDGAEPSALEAVRAERRAEAEDLAKHPEVIERWQLDAMQQRLRHLTASPTTTAFIRELDRREDEHRES